MQNVSIERPLFERLCHLPRVMVERSTLSDACDFNGSGSFGDL
jgi:hypothetical protein